MKKKIIFVILSGFTLINCHQKNIEKSNYKVNNVKNNDQKKVDLKSINLGSSMDDLLTSSGLNGNDNALSEYNVYSDYEEFQFPKNKNVVLSIFGNNLQPSTDDVSVFYMKNSKEIWGYEMELINNPNAGSIINSIENKVGHKPDFSEKKISTRERPIFLDENGGYKLDHIEENVQVWKDRDSNAVFFVIHAVNFSKTPNENTLKVFVLDKSSPKYKEWLSYRSLDLFYDK